MRHLMNTVTPLTEKNKKIKKTNKLQQSKNGKSELISNT